MTVKTFNQDSSKYIECVADEFFDIVISSHHIT